MREHYLIKKVHYLAFGGQKNIKRLVRLGIWRSKEHYKVRKTIYLAFRGQKNIFKVSKTIFLVFGGQKNIIRSERPDTWNLEVKKTL